MNPTKPIERVQRLKLADSVAEQLERLITSGDYRVGEKLPPERVLAEEFGVGRSSMREALRMVEAGGLLRTDHGVGVFVVSNTKNVLSDIHLSGNYTVSDLFEVRLSLECEAAALAAKRISDSDRRALQEILDKAANPQLSDDEFIALDRQLHNGIARASGNPLLSDLSESIGPLFEMYSHRVIGLPGRRQTAHSGHVEIVEAVAAGKTREARAAVSRHLKDVERDIVQALRAADGKN